MVRVQAPKPAGRLAIPLVGTRQASHLGQPARLRRGARAVAEDAPRAAHRQVRLHVVRGAVRQPREGPRAGSARMPAMVGVRVVPTEARQRHAAPHLRRVAARVVARDGGGAPPRPTTPDADRTPLGRRRHGPARAGGRLARVPQGHSPLARPVPLRRDVGSDARPRRSRPRPHARGRHLAAVARLRACPDAVAARMPRVGPNQHRGRLEQPRTGRGLRGQVHLEGSGTSGVL